MIVKIYTTELVCLAAIVRLGAHREIIDNEDGVAQHILDEIQAQLNKGEESGHTSHCIWHMCKEEDANLE